MKLERIVQIHVAVLASIGAMLLGIAQGDLLLTLLVIFAAITSVIFTDTLNWLRLNRVVANLAALVALFACLSDFFQSGIRNQLLAVANLLVYLQIVLFYQRKTSRLYWQLTVLSLLQVVVSGALNVPVEFGLLLVLYAWVAISTLTFFFLHREIARVAALGRGGSRQRRLAKSSPAVPIWRRLLDTRPRVSMLLAGRRLAARVLGPGLYSQVGVMGATTLVFSLVLFFAAPRLDSASGRSAPMRAQRAVGFSSEITLNELTQVLQSNQTVMRVSFREHETNDLYRVSGSPYLRGTVLADYVTEGGVAKWKERKALLAQPVGSLPEFSQLMDPYEPQPLPRERPLQAPPRRQLVRQEAILEPLNESVLFAVHPAFGFEGTSEDVAVQPVSERLYSRQRQNNGERREYRFALLTTAFIGGLQVDVTPHEYRRRLAWNDFYVAQELLQLTRFDASRFPQLTAIADEIGRQQRAAGANRATLARALRDHFLESDDYQYTLDFRTRRRDSSLDPMEDFVANHRTGHCEYYAGALALMLRSQGIPCRLVVGFHCDEYNTVGGYYQVRQRHAHAWVEAYLEPQDVSREIPPDGDVGPYGGWLRLDATPGANVDQSASIDRGMIGMVDDVLDYARLLWTDYILGLTASRQKESIYDPVSERADPEAWSDFWDNLTHRRHKAVDWLQAYLFSPLTLGAATLAALLVGLGWARIYSRHLAAPPVIRRVSRWTARLAGQHPPADERAAIEQQVSFYRRFERLLLNLGLVRAKGQTQQEFADAAQTRLSELPDSPRQWTVPHRIAAAFYRIRFGREELTTTEAAAIEADLSAMEQRVAERAHPK